MIDFDTEIASSPEKVRNGIEFFNKKGLPWTKLNPTKLNMESMHRCIACQLCTNVTGMEFNFLSAIHYLGISFRTAANCGLVVPRFDDSEEWRARVHDYYDALEAEWVRQIILANKASATSSDKLAN